MGEATLLNAEGADAVEVKGATVKGALAVELSWRPKMGNKQRRPERGRPRGGAVLGGRPKKGHAREERRT
jgi:hypothetical protein